MGFLKDLWNFGKIEPKSRNQRPALPVFATARNKGVGRHGGGEAQQRQNVGRGRSRAKYAGGDGQPAGKPARTRAQMEDRADRRPIKPYGARQTPRDDARDGLGTRNYPVRGNVRQKSPTARTRAQVEARADRAGVNPHRKSSALSPKPETATGRARRPAAALPKVAAAVDPKRRFPQSTARTFSGPLR